MVSKHVVIEGPPCSGTTTALATISAWCQEHNFVPIIVPEPATPLINSGLNKYDPLFQGWVIEESLNAQRLRQRVVAEKGYENVVYLYDTWLMRGQAYVQADDPRAAFTAILEKEGVSLARALGEPDGVIFLETAAIDAAEFYTLENNEARDETPEQAIELNHLTHAAWNGAQHLQYIANAGRNFEQKMQECIKALSRILGVPEPIESELKYVLHNFALTKIPDNACKVSIVQTYLVNSTPNVVERVRARGYGDDWLFFHTKKEAIGPGTSIETERMITQEQYERLLIRRDLSRSPIHKDRYCFSHGGHYWELDVFAGSRAGLVLLEVELHDLSIPVTVPPFLGSYTDVTDDPSYGNYQLSLVA